MSKKLVVVAILIGTAACSDSGGTPHVDLTMTSPDGTETTKGFDGRGWSTDSLGTASMAWPDIAGWGTDVTEGLLLYFTIGQPGAYPSTAALYRGEENHYDAPQSSVAVQMDVEWTGDANHPFVYKGTVEGVVPDGTKYKGTFNFRNVSLEDPLYRNLLAWRYPTDPIEEQVWTVESWLFTGNCPESFQARFPVGATLTIDHDGEAFVEDFRADCVMVDDDEGLCGASEEMDVDGSAWDVVTHITPGNSYLGDLPKVAIRAAPVDRTEARTCAVDVSEVTAVSGTR